ncbi:GNAT family N-acetyltransferase [Cellulomonas sp. zg-ZUI222]|uniref:GNAT family N-acetyltransferase n=1 Tax=Cellulomonas wangleii TaxID=2816956 RepID=A0ABX8D4Z4_9CELL|nr:GNAT family N-acetyltransferase [Cellulomonas wangleii]MBO0920416.1 GNAT family N-acetyltransferase [Cellulomonas wangleii]MBO0923166.1 GNAT family N-acetyltransferase [Cellulomonas wangleii]QVI61541.1 GNAT family N-acetyltransferase [Cellulomonas wangleii]
MTAATAWAVRTADVRDAPALAALAAVTFPLACPPGSTLEDQRAFLAAHLSAERFARHVVDPARVVLVAATPDGELLGYTVLVAGEPADEDARAAVHIRPTVELSKCYVHPDHHGAGVASTLLRASFDHGRALGGSGMWLGVNQHNARAQAFYAREGFAVVGVKHFQVGGRLEDDYVLERPL